jgi:DNA-binding transcriptional ArsR family regulator
MAANNQSSTEDRDQQILRRLTNIEHKVDSLEQTNAFALRADAEKHFESVKKIFKGSIRRAQVYLAANGRRGVGEIATLLGMQAPNVSTELAVLDKEGLLEPFERVGGKSYWRKTPIDRSFRISQFLMKEYGLKKDGSPVNKD